MSAKSRYPMLFVGAAVVAGVGNVVLLLYTTEYCLTITRIAIY